MVELLFNEEVVCPFSKEDLLPLIKAAAKKDKKIWGILEVTVVSEATIKKLNKKYRNKNKVTDVLSFSLVEGDSHPGPYLGEIYICYKQILRQAKEFNVEPKDEFGRMLVHGLLHLIGHDHIKDSEAKKMFSLQEKILDSVK